jgi:hypothetical protein
MNTKKFVLPVHSIVDLITNSSSEVYVVSDRATVEAVRKMVNAVLKAGGSTKTCDDLVKLSLVTEDGGYGNYKTVHAEAIDPASKDAATLIDALNNAFQGETIGNE